LNDPQSPRLVRLAGLMRRRARIKRDLKRYVRSAPASKPVHHRIIGHASSRHSDTPYALNDHVLRIFPIGGRVNDEYFDFVGCCREDVFLICGEEAGLARPDLP